MLHAPVQPVFAWRRWTLSALPMAVTAGMQLVNGKIDLLILGWLVSAEGVGLYRVAFQAATITALGLQTLNMVLSPHFAHLYASGEMARLQRVITLGARMAFALALPVTAVLMVSGDSILVFIFGEAFRRADGL